MTFNPEMFKPEEQLHDAKELDKLFLESVVCGNRFGENAVEHYFEALEANE